MSIGTIQHIEQEIKSMSPNEKLDLMEVVLRSLRDEPVAKKRHSLLELRGLGKNLWEGIEPTEFVRKERESC